MGQINSGRSSAGPALDSADSKQKMGMGPMKVSPNDAKSQTSMLQRVAVAVVCTLLAAALGAGIAITVMTFLLEMPIILWVVVVAALGTASLAAGGAVLWNIYFNESDGKDPDPSPKNPGMHMPNDDGKGNEHQATTSESDASSASLRKENQPANQECKILGDSTINASTILYESENRESVEDTSSSIHSDTASSYLENERILSPGKTEDKKKQAITPAIVIKEANLAVSENEKRPDSLLIVETESLENPDVRVNDESNKIEDTELNSDLFDFDQWIATLSESPKENPEGIGDLGAKNYHTMCQYFDSKVETLDKALKSLECEIGKLDIGMNQKNPNQVVRDAFSRISFQCAVIRERKKLVHDTMARGVSIRDKHSENVYCLQNSIVEMKALQEEITNINELITLGITIINDSKKSSSENEIDGMVSSFKNKIQDMDNSINSVVDGLTDFCSSIQIQINNLDKIRDHVTMLGDLRNFSQGINDPLMDVIPLPDVSEISSIDQMLKSLNADCVELLIFKKTDEENAIVKKNTVLKKISDKLAEIVKLIESKHHTIMMHFYALNAELVKRLDELKQEAENLKCGDESSSVDQFKSEIEEFSKCTKALRERVKFLHKKTEQLKNIKNAIRSSSEIAGKKNPPAIEREAKIGGTLDEELGKIKSENTKLFDSLHIMKLKNIPTGIDLNNSYMKKVEILSKTLQIKLTDAKGFLQKMQGELKEANNQPLLDRILVHTGNLLDMHKFISSEWSIEVKNLPCDRKRVATIVENFNTLLTMVIQLSNAIEMVNLLIFDKNNQYNTSDLLNVIDNHLKNDEMQVKKAKEKIEKKAKKKIAKKTKDTIQHADQNGNVAENSVDLRPNIAKTEVFLDTTSITAKLKSTYESTGNNINFKECSTAVDFLDSIKLMSDILCAFSENSQAHSGENLQKNISKYMETLSVKQEDLEDYLDELGDETPVDNTATALTDSNTAQFRALCVDAAHFTDMLICMNLLISEACNPEDTAKLLDNIKVQLGILGINSNNDELLELLKI
ncbi:MAG: hypothetical protein LBI69_00865 [Puniceicoccales bacterium]|jgi:hypothetical protein|nr:hypothetical protein [Puniceicoccales bacterium]